MNNRRLFRGVSGIYRYYKLNHLSNRSWRLLWNPISASTEIELSNWIVEKPVLKNQPRAIFSSIQKFGKGQYGRIWHSPKGGVWVSAAINTEGSYEKNSELYGLAIALALVERIELKGINVKIKWPNDLLVNGKKLAGILPRLFFRGGELRLLRVGIGLNVLNKVPQEATSLKEIIENPKINFWSSEVLYALDRSFDLLKNKKLLCSQIEKRLWAKKYIDQKKGYEWDIEGIDYSGGLIIHRGSEKIILRRE